MISINNDSSYPNSDCGTATYTIECESGDVTFEMIGFYGDNDVLGYRLDVANKIDGDFETLCTLKVFYEDFEPNEDSGV